MAKEKEEVVMPDMIDDSGVEELVEVPKPQTQPKRERKRVVYSGDEEDVVPNCLRNERIIVRYIPRATNLVSNPKHIFYGGMAENAVRTFVVPRLTSGTYVNVLTKNEKKFLEQIMGLELDGLSVYKKVDNFWDDSNDVGISRVRLTKQDNYLNLADPEDYIRYKILLANKDFIAPSMQALEDYPKASYQFVIISEGEETRRDKKNMSSTMQSYKEFGKIEDDFDTLRVIVETIDGRPTAPNVKLEFLQTKVNGLIQADSKLFLRVITDPLLSTKVLIKRAVEAGHISKKGDWHYLRSDGSPLCEMGEEPTLNITAKYLNNPKHQDVKFALEAKLK